MRKNIKPVVSNEFDSYEVYSVVPEIEYQVEYLENTYQCYDGECHMDSSYKIFDDYGAAEKFIMFGCVSCIDKCNREGDKVAQSLSAILVVGANIIDQWWVWMSEDYKKWLEEHGINAEN